LTTAGRRVIVGPWEISLAPRGESRTARPPTSSRCATRSGSPSPEVVAAAARGDEASCRKLHDWLLIVVPRMLRCCAHRGTITVDAIHDVIAEVLLAVRRYRGESTIDTWVFAVVRRISARRIAGLPSLTRVAADFEGSKPNAGDPSRKADSIEWQCSLSDALQILCLEHPRRATCLLAVTIWGLEPRDVAQRLGITLSSVWQEIHRARGALRSDMHEMPPRRARRPVFLPTGCPFENGRATFAWCESFPPPCLSREALRDALPGRLLGLLGMFAHTGRRAE
jgi:RNA polymerase sigma factor (sigma-70 family)